MRLAILFSGQGRQCLNHWLQVKADRRIEIKDSLRLVLPEIERDDFEPSPEFLSRNAVAQPLIFAYQMILWESLKADLPKPVCVAGYSLGELAACSLAGLYGTANGIRLAANRARLMDASTYGQAGMIAILGLPEEMVSQISELFSLKISIRNSQRHFVITGQLEVLEAATMAFLDAGANRVVPVAVKTPSHTPILSFASEAFLKLLKTLPETEPTVPVLSAIDGRILRTQFQMKEALAKQICTQLDWATCLEAVKEMRPDAVLEIGPGNAQSRYLADIAPDVPIRATDDFRSVSGIITWVNNWT